MVKTFKNINTEIFNRYIEEVSKYLIYTESLKEKYGEDADPLNDFGNKDYEKVIQENKKLECLSKVLGIDNEEVKEIFSQTKTSLIDQGKIKKQETTKQDNLEKIIELKNYQNVKDSICIKEKKHNFLKVNLKKWPKFLFVIATIAGAIYLGIFITGNYKTCLKEPWKCGCLDPNDCF